jgi:hypothetical protein
LLNGTSSYSPIIVLSKHNYVMEYDNYLHIMLCRPGVEVKGEEEKHTEEFHNLYSSTYIIIRMVKSKKIKPAGRVSRTGEMRNGCKKFSQKN